jgi:hypothetical protein
MSRVQQDSGTDTVTGACAHLNLGAFLPEVESRHRADPLAFHQLSGLCVSNL